jgi:hypothetical protein
MTSIQLRSTTRAGFVACGLVACFALPAQAATPNLVARVSAVGGLISGNGVSGLFKFAGAGRYEVTFNQPVNNCAFLASTVGTGGQATTVYTAGGHLSVNGVYVETKNAGGGLSDAAFELIVNCGANGMRYAVIDYAGNLARSSLGAAVMTVGIGQYEVSFPSTVKNCAYVATVADPGNALVFNPSGVYTASGPNANTVFIETKNPGGGLQNGVPFHLGVICSNSRSRYGVVQSSGIISRGSSLSSSFRAATGRYTMVTTATLDPKCAAVGTRGSTNAAAPFTPATVEVVTGPASNTRGFEVRELAFFGGAYANEAFHAAVVCP